jgi:lipopolysaccharide export LptBFGC system permease protein LptF
MIPEHEDPRDAELSPASASLIRKVADVLGVIAGVLFLIAFGLSLSRQGEPNLFFLGMGVLFLLFPLFMKKLVGSDR